jgi:hypothetical protein
MDTEAEFKDSLDKALIEISNTTPELKALIEEQ